MLLQLGLSPFPLCCFGVQCCQQPQQNHRGWILPSLRHALGSRTAQGEWLTCSRQSTHGAATALGILQTFHGYVPAERSVTVLASPASGCGSSSKHATRGLGCLRLPRASTSPAEQHGDVSRGMQGLAQPTVGLSPKPQGGQGQAAPLPHHGQDGHPPACMHPSPRQASPCLLTKSLEGNQMELLAMPPGSSQLLAPRVVGFSPLPKYFSP